MTLRTAAKLRRLSLALPINHPAQVVICTLHDAIMEQHKCA